MPVWCGTHHHGRLGCLAFRQHFSSIVFVIKISTAFTLEYMSSLLILLKFYILLLIKIKENIISIIQSAPSLRAAEGACYYLRGIPAATAV